MNQTNILRAWSLIEMMTPADMGTVDKMKVKMENEKGSYHTNIVSLQGLEIGKPFPWQKGATYRTAKGQALQFCCYIGVYKRHHIVEITRAYYENRPKELINPDNRYTYIASIMIDQDGNYKEDSFYLPMVSFLLGKMQSNQKFDYASLEMDYKEMSDVLKEKAAEILVNGVEAGSLKKLFGLLEEKLSLNIHSLMSKVRDSYYVRFMRENEEQMINSHFIGDLGKILKQKEIPEPLYTYLSKGESTSYTNVDEERSVIEQILEPKNLPSARWPSNVDHRLSLMQQVAVNLVLNHDDDYSIRSVNGPPGTGKTTLLQEIFANIVTNRALKMAKLVDPKDGFREPEKVSISSFPHPISYRALAESLKGHRIVVASSNNTAVENISKELPAEKMDEGYSDIVEELDLFKETASVLLHKNDGKLDENVWGMFSVALGNSTNINAFTEGLMFKGKTPFRKEIQTEKFTLADWEKETEELKSLYKEIRREKRDLQQLYQLHMKYEETLSSQETAEQKWRDLQSEHAARKEALASIENDMENYEKKLRFQPKVSGILTIFSKRKKEQAEERQETERILADLVQKKIDIQKDLDALDEEGNRLNKLIRDGERHIAAYEKIRKEYEEDGAIIPDDAYWADESYANRQEQTPWLTDSLMEKRGRLFLQAMKVHKLFIYMNGKTIASNLNLFHNRKAIDSNTDVHVLQGLWDTISICTPVISSTFASIGRMFNEIGANEMDYLFIDEAGQAVPQHAAGAIWRSKHVVAVGDPVQIEPVVTIDRTLLKDIQKYFKVDDAYISESSSVQVLADAVNPFGMEKEDGQKIGIPLWVHRRCDDPMFSIANEMAYDGNMVLAKQPKDEKPDKLGDSRWIDVKGKAIARQYVNEQGLELASLLKKLFADPNTSLKLDDIYVISPFNAVCYEISKLLSRELQLVISNRGELKKWLRNNIGTVHRFQGKEAHTVFFVCGTDETQEGAAEWICQKPNILNVAVTRAKSRFIIIADEKRFKKKNHFDIIHKWLVEDKLPV